MRFLTKAEWTKKNPLLYKDEYGVERDTGKTKLGDGNSRWNQLNYTNYVPESDDFASGGVKTVAGKTPDSSGNVNLTASDVPSGTFGDNQIPSSVARDTEVASAVNAAVAALVASSPAALDTLKELATALGNDPNFATTMTNALTLRAVTVIHGADATKARPTTSTAVVWYGSVTPNNQADGDVFVLVS